MPLSSRLLSTLASIGRRRPALRVLITNVGIANRTGTEIVAMDLAAGLARLGHRPMLWAPVLDPAVAAPLIEAGIPVVSDLSDLPDAPDVIHGHHHLETIAALRHFPGVPAIFVCHSGYWWHDAPPRHPRIARYVAVDDYCYERLRATPWIDKQNTATVLNAVDMRRYGVRPKLPSRPRRALIFSNYAGPHTHLEPILAACRQLDIEIDTLGSGTSTASPEPEHVLPAYDLVFAKARCAIEAMAVGCAVILCDTTGLGGMVTTANVRELRRWNFGFRVLQQTPTPELIIQEIRRYDAADAQKVGGFIRKNATLDSAVQHYLRLYRSAIDAPLPTEDALDWHPETVQLHVSDQAQLRLRFATVPQATRPGQHFTFDVTLSNNSNAVLATAAPWPSLLMYRWLDARTRITVVEHGLRSILQPPVGPGQEATYTMHAFAPAAPGDYVLRVTIIQEGWRWLDVLDPPVSADAPIAISAEPIHEYASVDSR